MAPGSPSFLVSRGVIASLGPSLFLLPEPGPALTTLSWLAAGC